VPPGASRHVAPPSRGWLRSNLRERKSDDGASPQPDPLGHLSSRNRGSTGWRARCCTTLPSAQGYCTLDEASPTIPPHEPCSSRRRERKRKRHVKRVGLVWPPRGPLSRSRQAGRSVSAPLARSAHARPARMKVGPLAQSRHTSGAEGRFTRFSAKRIGIRRHPRCLPSTSCPVRAAPACACDAQARVTTRSFRSGGHVGQGVSHRLLPACGEHTARLTTFRLSVSLDGLSGAKARSP
jgi:hypothetical protein